MERVAGEDRNIMVGEHCEVDGTDGDLSPFRLTEPKGLEKYYISKFLCNAPTFDSDRGSVISNR